MEKQFITALGVKEERPANLFVMPRPKKSVKNARKDLLIIKLTISAQGAFNEHPDWRFCLHPALAGDLHLQPWRSLQTYAQD